jgi:translation initiation factor IF-2
MTDKIRVKDLSTELGISNKDLMRALRELDADVKSHMSVVEDEDVTRIREKFQKSAGSTEVVRTVAQTGVVVRRRKKAPETAETPESPEAPPAEAETPEEEVSATETPVQPKAKAVRVAKVISRTDESPAEPVAAPEAPEAQDAESAGAVGTADDAVAKVEEAEPVAAEAQEAEDAKSADDTEPAQSEAEATSEVTPESPAAPDGEEAVAEEGTEEDAQKKKKKRKKRPEPAVGPQVKVISRPEPKPEPAPKLSAAEADSLMPPTGGAPAAPSEGGEGEAGKKKRKKDLRVVEFAKGTMSEEERRKANLQLKKKKTVQVRDKTGGRKPGRRRRSPDLEQPVDTEAYAASQPSKAVKRKLKVEDSIRVSDMAHQMGVRAPDVIEVLMGLGVLATINQSLDIDTATLVAAEFGYELEKTGFSEEQYITPKEEDAPESLMPRPPVVTIMGHVDHGKTSLLDALRMTNVTDGEAGGITQHIGAYHVQTKRGEIVFLDTPGHEAFTAMRARGAQVTDLVVLVVAADDGVMDQTREAVNHSRAAGVPIVVAVNKIDKENADLDRVKRELAELELVSEDWGGDTIFSYLSAKQRTGLDEFLELLALQAEVMELKANPSKLARGHIVEARLDKGRGSVGTVLVQEGTLRQGDSFVCGVFSGKVRAMFDDQGKKIKEAGPAIPVEVQGFDGVPNAGDEFVCVADDKVARRISDTRRLKHRERILAKESGLTLETFLSMRADQKIKNLNLVLKCDVQGSYEAVSDALNKLSTDEVRVKVVHGGTGAINESDILLAAASQAVIIGFNVRPTAKIKEIAEQEQVEIRFYDIIYKLVEELKDAMSGMLDPIIREVYLGQAEVRETFNVTKVGTIAGCAVVDGKILRNAGVRLLRDGAVIYTGKTTSLKRFKDDVKEVTKGYECGMGLENYNDIKVGDIIEAFEEVSEKQTLA